MNPEKISQAIDRVPIGLVLLFYCLYLGYDYYQFNTDPASPLSYKKAEIVKAKESKVKLQAKLKEAQEFVKNLEDKKVELRKMAQDLQSMKETLSEQIDVPAFMKVTITEAKKIGMIVLSLKPAGIVNQEYYGEQTFVLTFRAVFAQLISFLERLSNVTEILRFDNLNAKPVVSASQRFVELEGTIEIKTYKYLGTAADNVGNKEKSAENPAGVQSGDSSKPATSLKPSPTSTLGPPKEGEHR